MGNLTLHYFQFQALNTHMYIVHDMFAELHQSLSSNYPYVIGLPYSNIYLGHGVPGRSIGLPYINKTFQVLKKDFQVRLADVCD